MKYASGIFQLRVVYIYVCFSDNKNTDVLLTYMHLYLCVIYGKLFLGLLCLHPIFKNASAETSLTTPSRDQIIEKKCEAKK